MQRLQFFKRDLLLVLPPLLTLRMGFEKSRRRERRHLNILGRLRRHDQPSYTFPRPALLGC